MVDVTSSITRDRWSAVLEAADPPTFGTIVEDLVTTHDFSEAEATRAIDAALKDGLLAEQDTDGSFPHLTLASRPRDRSGEQRDVYDPESVAAGETTPEEPAPPTIDSWATAEFNEPETGTWPPAQIKRDAWMCRAESKAPYAPWAGADAPVECNHPDHDEAATCAECGHHAGYKWGSDGSREHVHADHAIAREWAEMDPSLSSDLVFIQRDDDPLAFVDGDDVRDPDTGDVHPAFRAMLEHLGVTYADVSTSGSGVHAVYRGEIPLDGVPEATFDLDTEPFGANDDPPAIEIYDGKHVCIATGDHVGGTGTEVAEWCDDALADILRANGYEEREQIGADTSVDLDDHEPKATNSDETTDDIRDVFRALDRLDPKRVGERTIVREWTRGRRSFLPTWGSSDDNGTANYIDDRIWHDTGRAGGYGGPAVMAAIDANLITHRGAEPSDVSGKTFFQALDHLRDLGFSIPEYEPGEEGDDADGGEAATPDPLDTEAVFDPRQAWRAAGAVTRDDLDVALPQLDDAPDVVRAVALAEGLVDDLSAAADLDAATYFDLYDRARTEYGAPLPIYVDATRTADDKAAIYAAVEHLQAGHILRDLDSDITVNEPNDDELLAVINPAWEDSESGERVIAFDGGPFYCRKHNQTIDPLRVVALERGLIHTETGYPDESDYWEAYELARTEYDAPLPPVSWLDSELTPDPDVEAVLPPAEDLVGEFVTDRDGLDAERDRVEDRYRELAADITTEAVFSAEPSTGKTTAAIKTAPDHPTLLTAPRRELQKEYAEKAADPEIVGDNGPTTFICPVFSEPWEGVSRDAADAGVAAVRELGFDVLQDAEALRNAVAERLPPTGALEAPEPDDDAVHLDRATCDTAAGEHGLNWALRVETAHRLLEPRTIHERDRELFDADLPCSCDENTDDGEGAVCSYTEAYDYITDPERPIDLLIGSRVHAKVDSAKTYHYTDDGTPMKRPRTVVLDEAVVGDYTTEWGENGRHVATWLAETLAADVEDGTDLARQADRLRDGWIGAWVRGDGHRHLEDLRHRRTIGRTLVTVARGDDPHHGAEQARALLLAEGAVDTGDAVDALRTLLGAPQHELDRGTIQALRRLTEDGGLQAALDAVDTDTDIRAFDTPASAPGAAFIDAVRQPFDLLAETPDEDVETYLDRLEAAFDTTRDLLQGGADGTRELVVQARDGYAHPHAHLLLAGALGDDDDAIETHGAPIPGRDDPTRVNHVEVGQASVVYDRNGDGALLRTPPEYTDTDGGPCSVIGLDATPRRELWEQYAGFDDVEIVSPFADRRERRAFVRDTRNLQVVQTHTHHVNTYSGDPTGKSFDEDLELLREIADTYGSQQLRRDSLATTGDPAVITTKTVEHYLGDDLEAHTAETAHYWDVVGSNDLGEHKIGALLGAPHPGDDVIEQAALLAGQEITPDGHGTEKQYHSPVADAMLNHAWKDQLTQAVHRFGRDEDGAVVFVHSAAVDDDRLPVVGTGGVTTAWSDAGKAVRDALLPCLRAGGRFTVADIVDRVKFGRRTVQQKLGEFDRLGYLDREVAGAGRENVFAATADPGPNGHADLDGLELEPVGSENEQSRNGIHYTGTFGLQDDLAPIETPVPPDRPTLPGPSAAAAGPPPDDPAS